MMPRHKKLLFLAIPLVIIGILVTIWRLFLDPDWKYKSKQDINLVDITDRKYPTRSFKPAHSFIYPFVMSNGRIIFTCKPKSLHKEKLSICGINPVTKAEMVLISAEEEEGNITSVAGDGDWLAYSTIGRKKELKAVNLIKGSKVAIGFFVDDDERAPASLYSASGDQITWVRRQIDNNKTHNRGMDIIELFNLSSNQRIYLSSLPSNQLVEGLATDRQNAVVCLSDNKAEIGQISIINMYSREITKIKDMDACSEVSVSGRYVSWKDAMLTQYGSIFLYDLLANKTRIIAQDNEPPNHSYHYPNVGTYAVTWLSNIYKDNVRIYDLRTQRYEELDSSGGRTYTQGKYVVWVSDSLTNSDDYRIVLAKLAGTWRFSFSP